MRTLFRVKGHPDTPTRDSPDWSPPPGIPPAVWSIRMNILARMVVGEDDSDGDGDGDQVVVADLCCGHGILATGLVTGYSKVSAAIGIDRSAPEVEVARQKVLQALDTLAEKELAVDIRFGDGAKPLTSGDDVSTLVVAGVGGRTMKRVLSDLDLTGRTRTGEKEGDSVGAGIQKVILNPPAKDAAEVRAYLLAADMREVWVIDDERLCVENEQMHVMISATRRSPVDSSSSSSSSPPSASSASSSSSSSSTSSLLQQNDDDHHHHAIAETRTDSAAAADAWRPFGASGGDEPVAGTSKTWKPNAGDVIQWVGVKGDVLDLELLADEVIGPVLRRKRPPLLMVYLRDRLEWTEGKRRAAKLRLAKFSLERRVALDGDEEGTQRMAEKETEVREEVRVLGAIVSVMASLLGELELENYLR